MAHYGLPALVGAPAEFIGILGLISPFLSFSFFALFTEGEKPKVPSGEENLLRIVVSRVSTLTFLTARSRQLKDKSDFTGKLYCFSLFQNIIWTY